jgi:DSF synthase
MNALADVRCLARPAYEQIETQFEPELGVYWLRMRPHPRPCFNPRLLAEIRSFIDTVIDGDGSVFFEGRLHTVRYAVATGTSRVFNLGGDLALFREAVREQDRETLYRYSRQCIDDLYRWHRGFDLPITTLSLVKGEALGGGFEAALSSNVLIAEESARMGFPEVLFNLFPGMGAYSFLKRKVGRGVAQELITSGVVYSARQLADMGVVDIVTPDGTGDEAVYGYIRKHARSGNGRRGLELVMREFDGVTMEELERIADIWVDAALRLDERDLRLMERLVRAQGKIQDDAQIERAPGFATALTA